MSAQEDARSLAMDAEAFGSGPELEFRIRKALQRSERHGRRVGKARLAHAVRGWIDAHRMPDYSEHAHARAVLLDGLEELLDGFK